MQGARIRSFFNAAGLWVIAAVPAVMVVQPGLASSLFYAGLGLALLAVPFSEPRPRLTGAAWMVPAFLLVILALASSLWSIAPGKSLSTALNVGLLGGIIVAAGALGVPKGDAVAPKLLLAGLLLAIALNLVETVFDGPMRAAIDSAETSAINSKSLTLIAIIIWPLLGWLWFGGRRGAAAAVFIAAAAAIATGYPVAGRLALAAGAGVGLAALVMPRITAANAPRLLAALVLVIPLTAGSLRDLGFSTERMANRITALHRVEIWDYTWKAAKQRPVLGAGIGSAELLPIAPPAEPYRFALAPASHPHNAPLQVLAELGLVGLGLFGAFAYLIGRAVVQSPAPVRAFALASSAAAFAVLCVSYNLWTDTVLVLLAMPLLVFRSVIRTTSPTV